MINLMFYLYSKGKKADVKSQLKEATSNEHCHANVALMNEISSRTSNREDLSVIVAHVSKKLNCRGEKWRKILKCLFLVEHLLKTGSNEFYDAMRGIQYQFKNLYSFSYIDENNADKGEEIRVKSKGIVKLLENKEMLQEERDKYAKWNNRIAGVSSDGVSGNSVSSVSYNGGGVYGSTSSETYQGNSYLDRGNEKKEDSDSSSEESSEEDKKKKKKDKNEDESKSEDSDDSSSSEEEKKKKSKDVPSTSKISIKKPSNTNSNNPNILDFDFNTETTTTTNQAPINTNSTAPDFDSIFGAPSTPNQQPQTQNNQNVFDFLSQNNNNNTNSIHQPQQQNLFDFTSQSNPQPQKTFNTNTINMFQYQNNIYNNNIYQFPQQPQNNQKQTSSIPDDEFKEVAEPETKPKETKTGLNSLLDTKLVDLDNLNSKGTSTSNNSNFNFY